MYQLQGLEQPAAVKRLAESRYDLLIVEPTFTIRGNENFDARAMVTALKAGKPGRLVIAYVDIGEAEQFRTYWNKNWRRPTWISRGKPAFLLAPDPDGWQGDVCVAFWNPQWEALWLGKDGLIKKIMEFGFDGVYLDWVEAYDEKHVKAEARREGINPASAMVNFVGAIRQEVRKKHGVLIAQNAPSLIDDDPAYAEVVDGVSFEDTWFSGKADADWDSPEGGDTANDGTGDDSTGALLQQYRKYLQAGIPVFTVDYCLNATNAVRVYTAATNAGLIPLVTRVSLERMTTTPPAGIGNAP